MPSGNVITVVLITDLIKKKKKDSPLAETGLENVDLDSHLQDKRMKGQD